MKNPWLEIPASDYDNHMSSPSVGQSLFMSDVFKNALNKFSPDNIAILGSATGNGLEHIDSATVKKVTVFDINTEYLEILKKRFSHKVANLEIIQANLETYNFKKTEYSFILAGLIFEYLSPQNLIHNIANSLKPEGILLTILQQPSDKLSNVSNTQYPNLKKLSPIMTLIPSKDFDMMVTNIGLSKIESDIVRLKSGKSFHVGIYKKKEVYNAM